MEKRYDLSFMKEYAKIYGKDNRWLAEKFHCGTSFVNKILNAEYLVKEEPLEEIMYEFGYSDYETFKASIIKKTNDRKRNIQVRNLYSPLNFNFNNMDNKDRIIISILCENENISLKEITNFLKIENYDIKKVIKDNMLNQRRDFIETKDEKIIVRNDVNYKTPASEIFDYNLMSGKDRIIISLLCDDKLIFTINQIAEFTNYEKKYIDNIYKKVISNIKYVEKLEPGFQKTKA